MQATAHGQASNWITDKNTLNKMMRTMMMSTLVRYSVTAMQ
jgi:hypothetical protein